MNSEDLKTEVKNLEKRIEHASMLHHECLATVIDRFLTKDPNYALVSEYCLIEQGRVNTLMKELKENYL